ncbi:hypothetical protein GCM10009602_18990 [Nocardiopsis tropica]
MQGRQLGSGVDPQFVGQPGAEPLVGGERLALAARAVEGPDVGRVQAFAVGVAGGLLGQLGDERGVLAQFEAGQGPLLHGGHPQLFPPCGGGECGFGVRELGQDRAAPQAEGPGEQVGPAARVGGRARPADQVLEPGGVEVVRLQQVAGGAVADQGAGPGLGALQVAAQLGDPGLEDGGGPGRRTVAPQVPDEAVGGDGPSAGEQQGRQQGADLGVADPDGPAVVGPHGQRPQHPESHVPTVVFPWGTRGGRGHRGGHTGRPPGLPTGDTWRER